VAGLLLLRKKSWGEKMATKDFLSATKPLARSRTVLLVASVALAVLVACGVAAVAALEPAKAAFPGTNGKIAFLSDRDNPPHGNDIYVMDADGSGRTNLTAEMGIREAANAAWSPDGEKIAFAASTFMVDHLNSDIYTMNADGSAKTNLTNDAAANWGLSLLVPERQQDSLQQRISRPRTVRPLRAVLGPRWGRR
jgi:dipeptidyl aminopeptidase/acylaminoacyl peptidase